MRVRKSALCSCVVCGVIHTHPVSGNYHLAWSVPMADPTYVIPGAAIHSFCMFAPFFALYEKRGMVIQGLVILRAVIFQKKVVTHT